MELEDLKYLWKKNQPDFAAVDEAEIAAMLKRNSKSIVYKLKKSVWFELIFTVVVGVSLLVYALTLPDGALKWTSSSILIVLVVYSFYYVKKLVLLNRFNAVHENIRSNLQRLIENLSGYLTFYKRSYTILYPVYFFLGLLFRAMEQGATRFFELLKQPRNIGVLLFVAVVFYVCSTWLVEWLLKKLYGNHLEKLKGLLRDIDSMNNT